MFERARMFIADRLTRDIRSPGGSRIGGGPMTVAGAIITPDTAITISAVWACIRYLSQTVAVPPWHVFEPNEGAGSTMRRNTPADRLIARRPSPEWSSFQFRETLTHWALRWGNGYAEIERDQAGRPFALWPIHPERVEVSRDKDTGELFYSVSNGDAGRIDIAARDMFHIRGFGEGPVGVNVIAYAAQSLGWAKAAQIFGAAFFGNGATPTVVVRNKKAMSPAGLKRQRAEFDQLYKGPYRSHRTAHLDLDAEIEKISLDASESQLIQVHQHLVEEICRWFGVPPHKVMHLLRSTFSNIEHQAIEVVVDSITPWAKRFEDEADFKLFGPGSRYYTKINLNALMRGDMKARMEFYKGMQFVGAFSPDRILELEDENPIGAERGGDLHVMQQQMVPLDIIKKGPQQKVPAAPQPAPDASAQAARAEFLSMMEIVDG